MVLSQNFLHLQNLDIANKTLFFRNDFNLPMRDGQITDDTRLLCALASIKHCLQHKAGMILTSHLGRPGKNPDARQQKSYSLKPVAERLQALINQPVTLVTDWDHPPSAQPGQIIMMENVRFLAGETRNDPQLAQRMAAMCDIYVMDAFGTAHRKHASTYGIMQYSQQACAGFLLARELAAIGRLIDQPQHPVMAIVGGAKVSTKLSLLRYLAQQVDTLILGGGIMNTFIAAAGYSVGKSLYEPDLIPEAQAIAAQVDIPLPDEVVTAKACVADAQAVCKTLDQIAADDMILDLTPQFVQQLQERVQQTRTILWNGPLGVFELEQFSQGTGALAHLLAEAPGFTLAGGGDTLAAIQQFAVADQINYLSTGGGAFLALIEKRTLPVLEQLQRFCTKSCK